MDPTSGLFAGEGHIPLACTPDPVSAAPVTGSSEKCEVEFDFRNVVKRIHEDPRVTKPYTDEQWEAIGTLGRRLDSELQELDVRLTMGGEPTFVSIDDMDGAQWNTEALGVHKRERAGVLLKRLKDVLHRVRCCIMARANGTRANRCRVGRWAVSGGPMASPCGATKS